MSKNLYRILTVMLAAAIILCFSACSGEEEENNPNIGIWEGTTATMLGMEMDITDVFEDGLQLELKAKGKAVLTSEGTDYRCRWSYENGVLTVEDSSITMEGSIDGNQLILENLQDSGVDILFIKK